MKKDVVFIRNMVLAIVFAVIIGYGAHNTAVLYNLAEILDSVFYMENNQVSDENGADINDIEEQESADDVVPNCLRKVSDNIDDLLPYHEELLNVGGLLMRTAGVRDYYNQELGINVTRNNYVINQYDWTSTDYEISQMIQLKEYLDAKDIQLLYVNEPAKYIDDDVYRDEFGAESYLNRNADLFLKRLGEAGIDYIDLRDNIREEKLNSYDLFYRTDHHWTVPASKWAAEIIAQRLNDNYGYNIDLSLYADENFNHVQCEGCWLGEQGKKLAEAYVGLDDFTLITPNYNTSFSRNLDENYADGDFDIFIDYSVYFDSYDENGKLKPAKLNSWHYSYNGNGYIQNNNSDFGNVLIFGDSYERTLIPFMALGIRNIYKVEPRYLYLNNTDIQTVIDSGDYDTVILTYAQFMIGAHDNPDNANYRVFTFFE